MNILGLNAFHGDASAALLSDGQLVAAVEEERLNRIKHWAGFPVLASPFEEAAVVSIDGFGDGSSVMWGMGRDNRIEVRGSVQFPHSLGLYYTAFTQLLGFPNYGDEYKMMGLSAYGEPRFVNKVREV